MSHPGSPGHLHGPALSVIIPLDGGIPARHGRPVTGTARTPGCAPTAEDVERAIRSVLDQSVRDLEVLVVVEALGTGESAASTSPASALRRLSVRDHRVRLAPAAGIAAAVRTARAPLLTVLDPRDAVVAGAYEAMTSQLAASGSHAVVGAARHPCCTDTSGPWPSRSRTRVEDALDAVEDPLTGRLVARTRLWRAAVCSDGPTPEAVAVRALMAARTIDVLSRCVLARSPLRGIDDAAVEGVVARGQALARAATGAPALHSRLVGAWMRDDVVDLAVRAADRPSECIRRLRAGVSGLLPDAHDEAWTMLPLLDRALVWTLAHGTFADAEELVGSRAEESTACPLQLVAAPPRTLLHASPPVLDRIAALPAELLAVRDSDLRLIADASVRWRTSYCLEVIGLAYVRGLSAEDAGSLLIEAVDDDGAIAARGRARRRRAPQADIDADDPWRSHLDEGFIAGLYLMRERTEGKRVRLRAMLTVADRVVTAWLPDVPGPPDESADGPRASGTDGARAGFAGPTEVTLDSACISEDTVTLEGRAPGELGRIVVAARSRRGDYELVAGACRDGTWRAAADLHQARLARGEHALVWRSDSGGSGACLAGAFLTAASVELAGGVRSVRLAAGPDRRVTVTVVAPLTAFERSRYGRARLICRDPGPLRHGIVFESFGGRSTGGNPAAILTDLCVHGLEAPLWWTVLDGTMSAPPGATPVIRGSRAWFRTLRTARIIVTDDRLPDWFYKRPGQRIIQTWHGTPIRKLLLDAPVGTVLLSYRRLMARQAPQWDLLLARSDAAAHDLCAATGYTGQVLVGEQPRNIGLLIGDEDRRRVRAALGIEPGSRVVLYAPAPREEVHDAGAAVQRAGLLDPAALAARTETTVLVRALGHDGEGGPLARGAAVIDAGDYPNVESLMAVSDVLVSDYSSIAVDYALTGRPAILYVPDLARQRDIGRGLYRDWPESSGLPTTVTQADLVERVREALRDVPDGDSGSRPIDPEPIKWTLDRVRAWILGALSEEV